MARQQRRRLFFLGTLVIVAMVCLLIAGGAEWTLRAQRSSALAGQIDEIEDHLSSTKRPLESMSDAQLRENVIRSNAAYGLHQFVDGHVGRVIHRPYIGYRQTPSHGSNSLGYRGPEFEIAKPEGVFRILVYGGSFIWGTGAEDDSLTIPSHLQRLLSQGNESAKSIEVINCGDMNYCSTQESVYLLVEGVLLSPDLVVFVDGVNDTAWGYSNLPAGYHGDFHEMNRLLRKEPLKTLYTVHELEHLRREKAGLSQWGNFLLIRRLKRLLGLERPNTEVMNDDAGALDFTPDHLELVREFRRPEEYAWRYLANMRSVRALGKEFGFESIFFIQPVPVIGKPLHPVEKERLEKIRTANRWLNHELAYWESHYNTFADKLVADSADTGTAVVDLRYIFRDHPEALYVDDCHLMGIGYEYVASHIARALQDRDLLPQ